MRGSSPSPGKSRRQGDDLLEKLHPATAVEALREPTGALKRCLEEASASEQTFALKAATVSQKIHLWLEELSQWPWPKHGGPAGFELPPAKRRKLHEADWPPESPRGTRTETDPRSDVRYFGSLPADDVARYERRIDEIQKDLAALELEDIKSQVLHNHILPLSRPGTPFSDAGLSVTSSISYTKFDDLSAVVTALVVRTLPKLSRLTRLLNAWSTRLVLLRKTPALFAMFSDAEVALRSGWNAIRVANGGSQDSTGVSKQEANKTSLISRKDFEVMKSVLHHKITKAGDEVDSMLDALEAMEDTLPNEWLERLETMEADYARWETAAERQVRDGEQLKVHETDGASDVPVQPATPQPKIQIQKPSPTKEEFAESDDDFSSSPPELADRPPRTQEDPAQLGKPSDQGTTKVLVDNPSDATGKPGSTVIDLTDLANHQRDIDSRVVVKDPSLDFINKDGGRTGASVATNEEPGSSSPSPARPSTRRRSSVSDRDAKSKLVLAELDRNIVRAHPASPPKVNASTLLRSLLQQEPEPSVLESVDEGPEEEQEEEEEEELVLPPATHSIRRDSEVSMASTVLHGSPSRIEESDDIPFRRESTEPDLPGLPDPDEPFSSDGLSPPSSPPLRYKPRSTSVTFKYEPETVPAPERTSPPRSPLEPPIVFDPDVSYELESQASSPGRPNTTTDGDRRLQQQIGAILESIPLKIRLNNKASAINLNPPDFQPPRPRPRTSNINRQRSASSLSSRAATPSTYSRSGTPSYMLAPARNHGPRSKSSQDIRTYHLMKPGSDAPIKLFIRTVGENNERVMVRVGGGWSDLGAYLKEYASHHGQRSRGEGKVEVTDLPATGAPAHVGSSPSNRPASALDAPMTPLRVRKARKSLGEESARVPRTPLPFAKRPSDATPNSDASARSRASSKADWNEESSSLGLAGPKPKKVEVSEQDMAWIKSVEEKVRIVSNGGGNGSASGGNGSASGGVSVAGERSTPPDYNGKFGEMGKVGGTKRLFRRN